MPETRDELCVIYNPAASRGKIGGRLKRLRDWLGSRADFQASRGPGHAEELAHGAVMQGFPTVVAAGGDGTVHEVANGLLRAAGRNAAFGVIPLGSGNDYAASLGVGGDLELCCQRILAGRSRRVDVGLAAARGGRSKFFVNTLGLGLSGAVACESRAIHGLRGLPLYGLAALRAIYRHFHAAPSVLTIDGVRQETTTLYLAIALGQREGGGFVIAPDARLDDGWLDYLHAAGPMSRLKAATYLPRLASGRLPGSDPQLQRGRCREVTYVSTLPTAVHVDGEILAGFEDGIQELRVEIKPAALGVLA